MLLARRQPDKPAAATNKLCSIRTRNGVYTEFGIDPEDEVANSRFQRSELDWLIYNDPLSYAELILNGDPEEYLRTVTEAPQLDFD